MTEALSCNAIILCRSGPQTVIAWASANDSELIVHERWNGFGEFVLSHRRTGIAVDALHIQFKDRDAALRFADTCERWAIWKRIQPSPEGRRIAGVSEKELKSLQDDMRHEFSKLTGSVAA